MVVDLLKKIQMIGKTWFSLIKVMLVLHQQDLFDKLCDSCFNNNFHWFPWDWCSAERPIIFQIPLIFYFIFLKNDLVSHLLLSISEWSLILKASYQFLLANAHLWKGNSIDLHCGVVVRVNEIKTVKQLASFKSHLSISSNIMGARQKGRDQIPGENLTTIYNGKSVFYDCWTASQHWFIVKTTVLKGRNCLTKKSSTSLQKSPRRAKKLE